MPRMVTAKDEPVRVVTFAESLNIGITLLTFGSDSISATCSFVNIEPGPRDDMYTVVGPMLDKDCDTLAETPDTRDISETIVATPIITVSTVSAVLNLRFDIPFIPRASMSFIRIYCTAIIPLRASLTFCQSAS